MPHRLLKQGFGVVQSPLAGVGFARKFGDQASVFSILAGQAGFEVQYGLGSRDFVGFSVKGLGFRV